MNLKRRFVTLSLLVLASLAVFLVILTLMTSPTHDQELDIMTILPSKMLRPPTSKKVLGQFDSLGSLENSTSIPLQQDEHVDIYAGLEVETDEEDEILVPSEYDKLENEVFYSDNEMPQLEPQQTVPQQPSESVYADEEDDMRTPDFDEDDEANVIEVDWSDLDIPRDKDIPTAAPMQKELKITMIPKPKDRRNLKPFDENEIHDSHSKLEHIPVSLSSMQYKYRNSMSIPYLGNYNCQQELCREFLSEGDNRVQRMCSSRVMKNNNLDSLPDGRCHFMNGTNRAAVAIASFPGSGNTWIRGLLERATGICTGARYCDGTLRMAGFTGEYVTSGAVIGVKTHRPTPLLTDPNKAGFDESGNPKYGAAILLIRNPLDAIVAEYNREMSKKIQTPENIGKNKHVSSIGREYFGNQDHWTRFLRYYAGKWRDHVSSWASLSDRHPILVVRYEDVKEDAVREVRRMMEFLGVPYGEEELRERLSEDFDMFRRRKNHDDFDPYTAEQRLYVMQIISHAVTRVKKANSGDSLGLEKYMQHT